MHLNWTTIGAIAGTITAISTVIIVGFNIIGAIVEILVEGKVAKIGNKAAVILNSDYGHTIGFWLLKLFGKVKGELASGFTLTT